MEEQFLQDALNHAEISDYAKIRLKSLCDSSRSQPETLSENYKKAKVLIAFDVLIGSTIMSKNPSYKIKAELNNLYDSFLAPPRAPFNRSGSHDVYDEAKLVLSACKNKQLWKAGIHYIKTRI